MNHKPDISPDNKRAIKDAVNDMRSAGQYSAKVSEILDKAGIDPDHEAQGMAVEYLFRIGCVAMERSAEGDYAAILGPDCDEPAASDEPGLVAWDGEGLPPVGCVCEANYCEEWRKCEVIALFKQPAGMVAAFIVDCGNGVMSLDAYGPDCFRPIRSEGEKAVEDAMQAIDAKEGDHAEVKGVVECMIAAGYRKKERTP